MDNALKKALLISLPIVGVCAAVLYFLRKKEEDDLHEILQDVKTSRMKIIEMKIPNSVVGVVIGRGGSNIKEIQEQTDTKINFKDQDHEDFRTVYIKGTAEAAQAAENMIHEIIVNQPIIEVKEIWVPQKSVGRIIGRGGETIRTISRTSNVKIKVDSDQVSNGRGRASTVAAETRIVITGTQDQIDHAIILINEKVEEEMEAKRGLEMCQANRSPRNKPKYAPVNMLSGPVEKDKKAEKLEALVATGSDGVFSVFVSAVDTPSCFWVQVFNAHAVELDHLLADMTDYYSLEEKRKLHVLNELHVGKIVAAPLSADDRWYRAEVKEIEVNSSNEKESRVDLYYVDYGDSEWHKQCDVYQLRTDFLKLRFQAIECSLAKVRPSGGEQWSDKACELFENLTHVAEWKVLSAKVVSYDQQPRHRRAGSPVPCVSLFDTSTSEDINIAEELVKQNYAVWEDSSHNSSGAGTPSHRSLSGASANSTPVKRRLYTSENDWDSFS